MILVHRIQRATSITRPTRSAVALDQDFFEHVTEAIPVRRQCSGSRGRPAPNRNWPRMWRAVIPTSPIALWGSR